MREGRVLSRKDRPRLRRRSAPQRQTQVLDLPVSRMIALVPTPAALSSTICRPPHVLLRRVAVPDQSAEPIKVRRRDGKGNTRSHGVNLHVASPPESLPGFKCQTRSTSSGSTLESVKKSVPFPKINHFQAAQRCANPIRRSCSLVKEKLLSLKNAPRSPDASGSKRMGIIVQPRRRDFMVRRQSSIAAACFHPRWGLWCKTKSNDFERTVITAYLYFISGNFIYRRFIGGLHMPFIGIRQSSSVLL